VKQLLSIHKKTVIVLPLANQIIRQSMEKISNSQPTRIFSRIFLLSIKLLLLACLVLQFSSAMAVTVSVRVDSNNDDAEENISDGDMSRSSSDLEMSADSSELQIVGMRFNDVAIPQGAVINSAYIEFETDETDSGTTNLVIFGENVDTANQFANNDDNISSRPKTTASANWSPSSWTTVSELHQTPDISTIIKEIVDRAGWSSGNDLVLIIEPGSDCKDSDCQRTAESHDGESSSAPLLVIDYTVAPVVLGSCATYFPDTIQGHDAGSEIKFNDTGKVINDSDNILTFPSLDDSSDSGVDTCNTVDCTISSSISPALTLPTFITTSTSTDVSLSSGSTTIAITEIDQLNLSGTANVTFSASATTYIIDDALFEGSSQITFNPGIYWFNELEIIDQANIIINGPVTIFVNGQSNHFDIEDDVTINTSGNASDLAIVSYDKVHMKDDVVIKAVIYGIGDDVKVEDNASFTGAISATDKVEIKNSGTVTYENVDAVEIGDLCDPTEPPVTLPVAEYRFDELSWDGTLSEVIDNSGNNNNGTAVGGITTTTGKICLAADIPSNSSASIFQAVDTGVDLDTIIGSTGTISLWYNSNTAWNSGSDNRLFDATDGDKYFLADISSDGRVQFFFEDGNDGDYQKSTVNAFTVGAGVWKHLTFVWDIPSNTAKIYVDGVDQTLSGNDGGTTAFSGYQTLYFGDNRNASYSTGESSADGLIDEALVFDSVLTSAEIQTIFTNQDAGNNYDGSSRSCPVIPPVTCDNGILNAVGIKIDNSGSNTQISTTTEALAIHAAWLAAGSPASGLIDSGTYNVAASGSSTVDRLDFGGDGHDFSGTLAYPGVDAGVSGSDFLVHTSGTLSLPAGDYTIYAETDDGFSFIMDTLSGDTVSFNKFGSSTAGASNELRFEAPTSNSNTGGSFTLSQDSIFDIAAIFYERGGQDYLEISIANAILTSAAPSGYEILQDGALGGAVTLGSCAVSSQIDHYEITHDGAALSCADETLTIKACTNTDCSTVSASDVAVTLSATGAASTWSLNPLTIPGGSSAGITVDLGHTTAETITLGATSTTAATNPVVCIPDCDLIFSEAGFILSLANHQSCTAPSLVIQAVKMSDTGTSCAPAYIGNQSVNFAFNYNNPATGSRIPILDSSTMAAATVAQNRTINFDATASSTLSFQYNDAGQVDVTVSDGADNGLTSATISPIVSPAQLLISTSAANNACTGPNYGNCTAFKVAGTLGNTASEFDLDISGACSDNSVTPNFQLNTIVLSSNLVAPATGSNASLGTSSADITTAGTVTVNQTITEVGAFSITATPPSYLGQTIPAATSSTIGRFTPAKFIVTDNSPLVSDATCDFTYQSQPFDFAPGLSPEVTLRAVNSAGTTTQNYGGNSVANNDFWKLDASLLSSRSYINQVASFPGALISTLGSITTAGETNYDGSNTFTLATDQLTYNKSAVVPIASNDAPFEATAKLQLSATSLTDSDGVFYDPDNNNVSDPYLSTDITGTNIRWGRWFVANAFGSELQPLVLVAEAQYFDGSNFLVNSTDICTTSVAAVLSDYSDNLSSGETTLTQGTMVSGLIPLTLSAPGNGNDGSLLLTLTTPAWMLYDYDGDATRDNAGATATFGIFEGRTPVIIKRQQF
jgi:MSHA biogenesis protein MshQ